MSAKDPRALSEREEQVMRMASRGLTDEAIAHRLGLGVTTVNTYWSRIRGKRGRHGRTELVAEFILARASEVLDRLTKENEELRQTLENSIAKESELSSALRLMHLVVDTAPDAILVVDRTGAVRLANERAAELLGYPVELMATMHIRSFVPERFHGEHNRLRLEYMAKPVKRLMGDHRGTTAVHADGHELPIAATLSAFEVGDELLVTCMIRSVFADPL